LRTTITSEKHAGRAICGEGGDAETEHQLDGVVLMGGVGAEAEALGEDGIKGASVDRFLVESDSAEKAIPPKLPSRAIRQMDSTPPIERSTSGLTSQIFSDDQPSNCTRLSVSMRKDVIMVCSTMPASLRMSRTCCSKPA
jgi:hypothetical protein